MTARRAPAPVLLLLLALAALLTPQTARQSTASAPAAAISRAVVSVHAETSSQRGGVEHKTPKHSDIRTASSAAAAPHQSATARDAHVSGPALLLVQRPRPPTEQATGTGPRAATGRSPPSPAGT